MPSSNVKSISSNLIVINFFHSAINFISPLSPAGITPSVIIIDVPSILYPKKIMSSFTGVLIPDAPDKMV